ncbi:MAG: hypothetical protein AB1486_07935 [Planctomycetota bacterium]
MTGPTRHSSWCNWPLLGLAVSGVLANFLFYHPTTLIDDAYISLRYAENIARGHGIVWNPGERIQGASTPLYVLLLAALRWLGLPSDLAARGIGLLAGIATCYLSGLLVRSLAGLAAGAVAILVLVTHPHLSAAFLSGMETTCVTAVLTGMLLALHLGQTRQLGYALGVLALLRLDGVAAVAASGLRFLRDPRSLLRAALQVLGLALPWFVFAWIYFGSPLPHSVAAKAVLPVSPTANLELWWASLFKIPPGAWVSAPALLGLLLLFLKKRGLALWVLAYATVYVGGYTISRVHLWPWYVAPIHVLSVILAVFGIVGAVRLMQSNAAQRSLLRQAWIPATVAALLVLPQLLTVERLRWRMEEGDTIMRSYFAVADYLNEVAPQGSRIYVGEVGAVGYKLLDHHVIDSSGINSPEMVALTATVAERRNQADRERLTDDAEIELQEEAVRCFEPDWITSRVRYLHLKSLLEKPWFAALYQPVRGKWDDLRCQTTLLKRVSGPKEESSSR